MRFSIFFLIITVLLVPLASAEPPDRNELTTSPRFLADVVEPVFVELDPARLEEAVRVVSSRNSAAVGFNTPEVQIHLPRCNNSVYAVVDFSDPVLVDAAGGQVKYERERGIYDHDLFLDELRFAPPEGGDKPVSFVRVKGSITLRYPVRMRTVSVAAGEKAPGGMSIEIDGPYVTLSDFEAWLPKAAAFGPFPPFRAYDRQGRALERDINTKYAIKNNIRSETYAFWGEVAELRLDLVDTWIELAIDYDLPPEAVLPMELAGTPQTLQGEVIATAGGLVTIRQVVAAAATPAALNTLSKSEAVARLKPLGVRNVDASALVMAVMHGKSEAVDILLAAGVPLEGRHVGMTPLLAAAMYGKTEIGIRLIAAGADVNATDANDATPLIRAASRCANGELVKALIAAGADVNASAKGGGTALMLAEAVQCSEIVASLRAAGAR